VLLIIHQQQPGLRGSGPALSGHFRQIVDQVELGEGGFDLATRARRMRGSRGQRTHRWGRFGGDMRHGNSRIGLAGGIGDPHHFVHRRQSQERSIDGALEQGSHAVLPGGLRDGVGRGTGADEPFHLGIHREDLHHAEPAPVSGLGALGASHGPIQGGAVRNPLRHPGRRCLRGHLAAHRTESPHQSLGDDTPEGRGDLVSLHSHVRQAGHAVGCIVRMQRRENEMAGERGLDRDLGGFAIPDLAHEHHVGVLPEDGSQGGGEGQPGAFVGLDLHDVGPEPVLDRVLDRDDVHALALDGPQRGVQRGGLPRSGRSGDQDDPLLVAEEALQGLPLGGHQAQRIEVENGRLGVEHPDDDLFPVRRGQGGDPEIHRLLVDQHPGPAILGPQTIGDVHPRHNLDPRDQRDSRGPGDLHDLPQHPVDPVAHDQPPLDRLDVDVAGPAGNAVGQQGVHQLDDRTLRGFGGGKRDLVLALLRDLGHLGGVHHAIQQPGHHILRPIDLVELLPDLPRGGQEHPHLQAGGKRQHLVGVHVEGIGRRHFNEGIGDSQGQRLIAPGQIFGHRLHGGGLRLTDVGQLEPKPGRHRIQNLLIRQPPELGDRFPHRVRSFPFHPKPIHLPRFQQRSEGGDQPLISKFSHPWHYSRGARKTITRSENRLQYSPERPVKIHADPEAPGPDGPSGPHVQQVSHQPQ